MGGLSMFGMGGKPPPGTPPAGAGRNDVVRLGVLALGAVVVGSAILAFMSQGRRLRGAAPEGLPDAVTEPVARRAMDVRPVEDPGDLQELPVEPEDAPAVTRGPPPPWVENAEIYKHVDHDTEQVESDLLYHLLHRAVTADGATLTAEARQVRHERILADPDKYVGKPVRFVGSLMKVQGNDPPWSPDPIVNPSGVPHGVWGLVVDRGWRAFQFLAPDIPRDVKVRDVVVIEGYFAKVVTFDNSARGKTRSPVMICKRIALLPPDPVVPYTLPWIGPLVIGDHVVGTFELFLVGFLLISTPIFVLYVRAERRQFARFREHTLERAKVELQRRHAAGAALVGAAPAGSQAPGATPLAVAPPLGAPLPSLGPGIGATTPGALPGPDPTTPGGGPAA